MTKNVDHELWKSFDKCINFESKYVNLFVEKLYMFFLSPIVKLDLINHTAWILVVITLESRVKIHEMGAKNMGLKENGGAQVYVAIHHPWFISLLISFGFGICRFGTLS